MAVIRGDLQHIENTLNTREDIASATPDAQVWLCIEVETQDYLTDLQQRIQALLDDKPAEILQLKRVRKQASKALSQQRNVQLSELSVEDVFEARLALEEIVESDEQAENAGRVERIKGLFKEAVFSIQSNVEDLQELETTKSSAESAKEQH